MAEKSLNGVHKIQQKRDAYGFALRPQHAERYTEYIGIYKEEEAERAEKWRNFLQRQESSSQLCSSTEKDKIALQRKAPKSKEETTSGKGAEGNDSQSKKSESDPSRECETNTEVQLLEEVILENSRRCSEEREPAKELQLSEESGSEKEETKIRKIQVWRPVRPSLAAIEEMMVFRVKRENYMQSKERTEEGDHLASIDEGIFFRGKSDEDSFEDACDQDTSVDTLNAAKRVSDASDNESQEPFFPWKEELEVLVRLGVPKDLRGEVWQAFVGVKARRVERYYQDLLAQVIATDESMEHAPSTGVSRKWRRQIEKDIPRTFPGHPALNDDGRDALRRILLAYACHNPSLGYCQAMNFFAGLLLLLMPEENAFWTLVGVIDDYFDGYYTEEMIESQVDQLVFEELTREKFPKLVNHLDYLGVQVPWISGPWFLSIFVNMLPWESVLRIWDVLLFDGSRVMLFRTALALMELYGPVLVKTKDAGDAITLLQTLCGSTFDSSQLVLTACMGYLAVTEVRLQELNEKHRPAVLEVVEERTKRGRVWKDSKGLASKLYSFKHDRSVLEEKNATERAHCEYLDQDKSQLDNRSSTLHELVDDLNVDYKLDSIPDFQEQVVWLKVELCRLLEEKRSAVQRAEELETALIEMVKQDNRRQLSARIEQLEQEVTELRQVLADKKEQETAMLQVLMRVEREQKLTEDARKGAEHDASAQRYAVHVLQEKYENAMAQIAQMEKRVVMAESMLEATMQYESGESKARPSARIALEGRQACYHLDSAGGAGTRPNNLRNLVEPNPLILQ